MTKFQTNTECAEPAPGLKPDSLTIGVSLLLALTVIQRLLGFGRNLLFCRLLDPAELGVWNLAFSLLMLAAPLIVFGLPGSFGRYVEYYLQRGQLRSFLRRTGIMTVLCTLVGVAVLLLFREQAAWMFFGDSQYANVLVTTVVCLAAVIAFNTTSALFTALRQVKTVSLIQFSNGILFAVFGLGLMVFWKNNAQAIIVGYGLACLITCLGAIGALRGAWRSIPETGVALKGSGLWLKLLPFAGFIWFNDLLCNLFTAADRYMIIHFYESATTDATEVVGQYHSSLVVPTLILAIANMASSVILPFISNNWELGNFSAVHARINNTMKLYGLGAICAGAGVIVFSPIIFDWALGGKYTDGLSVLPLTLMFCVWAGLGVIANQYAFCAEKASAAVRGALLGLVVNVAMNIVLLPKYGLLGAVLATACGHVVTMYCNLYMARYYGFIIERGTMLVTVLPLGLLVGFFGGPAILIFIAAALAIGLHTNLIFSDQDKTELMSGIEPHLDRLPDAVTRPIFSLIGISPQSMS